VFGKDLVKFLVVWAKSPSFGTTPSRPNRWWWSTTGAWTCRIQAAVAGRSGQTGTDHLKAFRSLT